MMDSTRRSAFGAVLLLGAMAVTFCAAQQPVVVRLSDAVGDTIDAAERDSFRLFPNTAGFQHAVILALPGPEFYADVTLADADTTRTVFYRIMPGQLERIRFVAENSQYIGQPATDSLAALALARFWKEIEDAPLSEMPAYGSVSPQPARPRDAMQNTENRYSCALHGATGGSIAAGAIGSRIAVDVASYRTEYDYCGGVIQVPTYHVNHPLLIAATLGLTAAGAAAGYAAGVRQDREPPFQSVYEEDTKYRTIVAIAGAAPSLALAGLAAIYTASCLYGPLTSSHEFDNDPHKLRYVPVVLTGVCLSVELITAFYRMGRQLDRSAGVKSGRKRAPGP